MNALVFGEILWDIIEGNHHLGGAPLNFAAHLKKCGEASTIISALGNDTLGEKALALVKGLGVDIKSIQRLDKPTGYVPVTIKDGQPEYEITEDVAFDYIQKEQLHKLNLCPYDLFYFGSLIQRSEVSGQSLKMVLDQCTFDHVFYDVNLRKNCYTREIVEYSLSKCTILKVNDEEVEVISAMLFQQQFSFEEFCKTMALKYPQIKVVVITAGAKGCYIFSEEVLTNVHTEPISVVDTVGAGDSFSAAFASVYIKTGDALQAAKVANKVGGFVATSAGPIPDYPEEIQAYFL